MAEVRVTKKLLILLHILEQGLLLSAIYEYNQDGGYFMTVEGRWSGDVIATYNNQRSATECLMRCMQHNLCETINYNNDLKQCELNKKVLIHQEINLVPGWTIYYIAHQTEVDVTGNYCEQINCGDNLIETNKKIIICQDTAAQRISCPYDYQVICITNAFYGRQSARVCENNTSHATCVSASSTDTSVKKLCNGNRDCVLHASSSVFGNPCEGVGKYLEVTYVCSGHRPICPPEERTVDGNGGSACCVFPFIYNRKTYNECVKGVKSKFWCATTRNYDNDKLWGHCLIYPYVRERVKYTVKVRTGNLFGSGTDAKVFLTMRGDWGTSAKLSLKKSTTNDNPFEQGHTDIFTFNMLSLGKLKSIEVWQNNRGFSASWFLSFIEVVDTNENATYSYPCNCWLKSTMKRNLTTSNQ